MQTIDLKRTTISLQPDRTRVLARPFRVVGDQRSVKICARVMALPECEVHALLEQVRAEFGDRHPRVCEFLKRQFEQARPYLLNGQIPSEERALLLGGYFTNEFSLEAAALFNPSIVPHPDQSDLPPGSLRFILSLRATAEGHISSITFRTGLLDADNNITIDTPPVTVSSRRKCRTRIMRNPCSSGSLRNSICWAASTSRCSKAWGTPFTLDRTAHRASVLPWNSSGRLSQET